MVAAGAAVSRHHGEALNPSRPPLIPSEKDNAGGGRRPRIKPITSRYLSSSSSSTSTSSSGTTTSSSSSGSAAAAAGCGGARRCASPSPPIPSRPSTPPTLQSRRSHSVGRNRPDLQVGPTTNTTTTTTTTRSLSVSFQGESFFYQTSKAKAKAAASPKPTPERRRPSTPTRTSKPTTPSPSPSPSPATDHSENFRPFNHWPTARLPQRSNPLARSLDCSNKNEPILATVRLLQQSMVFDDRSPRRRHSSLDVCDLSSDTDSVSSGSNSGVTDLSMPRRSHPISRGVSVPARFWQESNSRLRRLPEPGTPISTTKVSAPPKMMASVKKILVDSPVMSLRSLASPLRGPIRHPSPSKLSDNTRSMRGMASPSRVRSSGMASTSPAGQPGNAPSIISFAVEVRRAKKGENRIEEAHMLRLLDNRQLQWRFMNARADAALMAQRIAVEENLYDAWITTTGMRESVTNKRIKLQLLAQNLKLTSVLKGQMTNLEEWSLMERDHSNSLSGSTEALKGSILRLPVVDGARADLQEVKDAVGSAVDMMHAMGSSICSLLPKVEGTSSLVSELAKVASQEQALLDQSRELLSELAAMHAKPDATLDQIPIRHPVTTNYNSDLSFSLT